MNFYLDILNNQFLFVILFFFVVFTFFLTAGILKASVNWRWGVVSVFFLLFFEDFLRKIIPDQPYQIIILKDALIFLAYCTFFQSFFTERKFFKPVFLPLALLFSAWCVVEIFNPNAPNFWFSLIGIRTYLWYIPMLFLGYFMFSDKEKLLRFCRGLVYMAIPLAIIAILQYAFFYVLPPELSQPLQTGHEIHYFGDEKIKLIPSIFGSAERFSSFSFFLLLMGLGLLSFFKEYSKKQKVLLVFSTILAFISVFVSGRRTPLYFSLLATIIFFLANFRNVFFSKVSKKMLIVVGVGILVFIVLAFFLFNGTAKFFAKSFPSIITRLVLSFKEISFSAKTAGLWGTGIGTRSQGLHYVPGGDSWYNQNISNQEFGIESGIGKVMAEMGFVGIILFLLFYGRMMISWFLKLKSIKSTEFYSIGLSIVLYLSCILIWFLKGHQILGDSTTLILFWFFMGVLFNLGNKSNENFDNNA